MATAVSMQKVVGRLSLISLPTYISPKATIPPLLPLERRPPRLHSFACPCPPFLASRPTTRLFARPLVGCSAGGDICPGPEFADRQRLHYLQLLPEPGDYPRTASHPPVSCGGVIGMYEVSACRGASSARIQLKRRSRARFFERAAKSIIFPHGARGRRFCGGFCVIDRCDETCVWPRYFEPRGGK